MSTRKDGWTVWQIIAAAWGCGMVLLGVLAVLDWSAARKVLWTEPAAAWVQAIGSMAGIWAVVWATRWQEQRRKANAQAFAEAIAAGVMGRVVIIQSAAVTLDQRCNVWRDMDADPENLRGIAQEFRSLPYLTVDEIRALSESAPNATVWLARAMARAQAVPDLIERYKRNPYQDSPARKELFLVLYRVIHAASQELEYVKNVLVNLPKPETDIPVPKVEEGY